MTSPYDDLPPRAFWRTGVTDRAALDPGDLYRPRFPVTREMRIVTAGSCFAQHVGRALRGAGLDVIDAEPLPTAVPDAVARRFGYRLYSARYGNIYTVRQLRQLLLEARGKFAPALPVWAKDGRYYDAQRPNVEPDGLDTEALVHEHRRLHLERVMATFRVADLFVFTFGLTEAWVHRETGTVYPTAPGTIVGDYDPEVFAFKNFDAIDVAEDFEAFRTELREINPAVHFLLTVSPVPPTATASGDHVEVATAYSKAVLRSVCGLLTDRHDDADYFPSYELFTSANNRGVYFENNKRAVSAADVAAAMGLFLNSHGLAATQPPAPPEAEEEGREDARATTPGRQGEHDAICEEALLDGFAR